MVFLSDLLIHSHNGYSRLLCERYKAWNTPYKNEVVRDQLSSQYCSIEKLKLDEKKIINE